MVLGCDFQGNYLNPEPGVQSGLNVLEPGADFWPKNRHMGQKASENTTKRRGSSCNFPIPLEVVCKYLHFGKVLGHFRDRFPSFPCHTRISSKCARTGEALLHGIFWLFRAPKNHQYGVDIAYPYELFQFIFQVYAFLKKELQRSYYMWSWWSVLEVFCVFAFS